MSKLHFQILPTVQQQLWEKLSGVEELTQFYLAGGTALALQIGHRESIDLDFFSDKSFSVEKTKNAMSKLGSLRVLSEDIDTLNAILDGVKVSFFRYKHSLIESTTVFKKIQIASLSDIIPMKLIAVSQRGTKKDFIDLYCLLHLGWNLPSMFEALDLKFSKVQYSKLHILKSLSFFSDADLDPEPKMLVPFKWEQCKEELSVACRKMVQL